MPKSRKGGLGDMAIDFAVVVMIVALLAVILAGFGETASISCATKDVNGTCIANANATAAINSGYEITTMFGDWTPLLALIALAVIGIAYMRRAGD